MYDKVSKLRFFFIDSTNIRGVEQRLANSFVRSLIVHILGFAVLLVCWNQPTLQFCNAQVNGCVWYTKAKVFFYNLQGATRPILVFAHCHHSTLACSDTWTPCLWPPPQGSVLFSIWNSFSSDICITCFITPSSLCSNTTS